MAAGKGTRMATEGQTPKPKVIYEVAGEPMVRWVVRACRSAGVQRCVVVVGYQGEKVIAALEGMEGVEFVEQKEQLGTGHAARMAEPVLKDEPNRDVFVLAGDGPLIRPTTLNKLLEAHRDARAAASLATAILDNPSGYGRIVRDENGHFLGIVEQKDATPQQAAIREVNPSYYCFKVGELFSTLAGLTNHNKQGEYYITDAPGMLKKTGKRVVVVDAVPQEDVLSINTPKELAVVDSILKQRLARQTAKAGN
ncbi:MAG: NTP transferase domain-containing protein [Phycisphaera sp.]|nr:NTP transferase domain-containing protein [Phycisphaera sp.]